MNIIGYLNVEKEHKDPTSVTWTKAGKLLHSYEQD